MVYNNYYYLGKYLTILAGHTNAIVALDWNHDSTRVVTGDMAGFRFFFLFFYYFIIIFLLLLYVSVIFVWDIQLLWKSLLQNNHFGIGNFSSSSLSSPLTASSSLNYPLILHPSHRATKVHSQGVLDLRWLDDTDIFASSSQDKLVKIFSLSCVDTNVENVEEFASVVFLWVFFCYISFFFFFFFFFLYFFSVL
jgi:WD40 repeat protein